MQGVIRGGRGGIPSMAGAVSLCSVFVTIVLSLAVPSKYGIYDTILE
jgi:hypothetical protein